ncbi:uncharacterized protein LOC106157757 [Lingula anatina]|uniref:Uncharacterized protein LOC106157757 n=1 Tax=Lingula anatina TaxID=7574 RepID=A0A2R2MQD9_LINAN|nr:uncharacterized protein LOC106157757 [Lingula anatina]|eukprot:XP_023932464.1 uncharacterized protein LOC106157757 [Lingula anatina]
MADSRLLWAARGGAIQSLQGLLTAGECNINVQDRDGSTPLHWAAICGQTQCVQLLLEHGADTNIQAELLLKHGADTSVQCVQLLLQHGADTSIQDKWRKIPRMVAEDEEHAAVAELLSRFELPDIQGYVQTRTLEHLAELLDSDEYTIINQTNLSTNFPDVLQFQKVQGLKGWAIKNNCTNIRDLKVGLQAANFPRLANAAGDCYAGVVTEILNMTPDEFEERCRTLVTARHMHTSRSTTTNQQDVRLPLDQYCYDAFIAYSGEDEETIEPVLHQLKELGVKLWYAKEDLIPGTQVITSISEAIIASKHTVAFLSKSFVQSRWCQQELQYAMQEALNAKRDVLIPVVMNISPEEIPAEIKGLKFILFDDEELIPKLSQAIKGAQNTPTYGELRDENEVLRGEVRLLTSERRLQSQ